MPDLIMHATDFFPSFFLGIKSISPFCQLNESLCYYSPGILGFEIENSINLKISGCVQNVLLC